MKVAEPNPSLPFYEPRTLDEIIADLNRPMPDPGRAFEALGAVVQNPTEPV